ncbi:MAG: Hpt domain-containing protein, partial [Desulfobacterales bacterium]|nr:Hpt domain-containing protein [Desulfobacterales bacterium]
MNDIERFKQQFFQEARDIIDKVNESILKVEADPENKQILDEVFRGIHTIKGSAGCFDLNAISDFTHYLEEIFNFLRTGALTLSPELIDVILSGTDNIEKMISDYEKGLIPSIDFEIVDKFKSFCKNINSKQEKQEKKKESLNGEKINVPDEIYKDLENASSKGLNVFKIKLKYTSELLENGYDPLIFLKSLKEASKFYWTEFKDEIPAIQKFNPLSLYLNPVVYSASQLSKEEITDLTFDPELVIVEPIFPEKINSENLGVDKISLKEFLSGALDMLESTEKYLMEYESKGSYESLNAIFRFIHNIKGDSDYVGLKNLSLFTHALESFLEKLRNGDIKKTAETIDIILQGVDFIRNVFRELE